MKGSKVSAELIMRWVPVVDALGRKHMEAVWVAVGEPQHVTHAA
jgi:hypothetical protein